MVFFLRGKNTLILRINKEPPRNLGERTQNAMRDPKMKFYFGVSEVLREIISFYPK